LVKEIKVINEGRKMKAEMFLQKEFTHWLDTQNVLYCASAGGMRTNIRTAVNMKATGYKKGFPDIFIYEARGGYHGLAIELKVRNEPTPEQMNWQEELLVRDYKALIMPSNLDLFNGLEWLKKEVILYLSSS
jgi:hypothetical protein